MPAKFADLVGRVSFAGMNEAAKQLRMPGLWASALLLGLIGCGPAKDAATKPDPSKAAPAASGKAPSAGSAAPGQNPGSAALGGAGQPGHRAGSPPAGGCFAAGAWSTPACEGEGKSAPPWWGPKRWSSLSLLREGSFKDARGRQHWSLTFSRSSKLKTLPSCLEAMRTSLKGRFPNLQDLPSTVATRGSFRGQSSRYQITVVCGLSAKDKALVNVDLTPLS